jgi:hypothetical protein
MRTSNPKNVRLIIALLNCTENRMNDKLEGNLKGFVYSVSNAVPVFGWRK